VSHLHWAKIAVAASLWATAVTFGSFALFRHTWTPGRPANPPAVTNAATSAFKGSLMLFLHPQCDCSRATVSELAKIEARCHNALHPTVFFYKPKSRTLDWIHSDLWNDVAQLPGVTALIDTDGRIAAHYGVHTSGQVLLYDAKTGRLVFSGGITGGRGHEGDNQGEDAIVEFANHNRCPVASTPVYGCAIG
jgi:hypothetical protein